MNVDAKLESLWLTVYHSMKISRCSVAQDFGPGKRGPRMHANDECHQRLLGPASRMVRLRLKPPCANGHRDGPAAPGLSGDRRRPSRGSHIDHALDGAQPLGGDESPPRAAASGARVLCLWSLDSQPAPAASGGR